MNAEERRKARNYLATLARKRRNKPRALFTARGGPYDGHELDLDWSTTGTATVAVANWRGHYGKPANGVITWVDEPSPAVAGVTL